MRKQAGAGMVRSGDDEGRMYALTGVCCSVSRGCGGGCGEREKAVRRLDKSKEMASAPRLAAEKIKTREKDHVNVRIWQVSIG